MTDPESLEDISMEFTGVRRERAERIADALEEVRSDLDEQLAQTIAELRDDPPRQRLVTTSELAQTFGFFESVQNQLVEITAEEADIDREELDDG